MKVLDVLTSPWAIQPDKLTEIAEIYSTHLKGDKIDIAGLQDKFGVEFNNQQEKDYDVIDGAAVIPIYGVLGKKMNLFSKISGGASTEILSSVISAAVKDDEVKSVILYIDSPGGTVDGTVLLADSIYNSRGKKPIIALANGVMASAAYWIGSAADKVYIEDTTTVVGSIGVVATHIDRSENLKKEGIKVTEIYAGKYKRIASENKPLSKEAKQSWQDDVNYLYSIFVNTVARNLGVDVETVLENMADGRTFIGEQAVSAGLVHGVVTLTDLIGELSSGSGDYYYRGSKMDINKVKAEYPDVFDAIFAQGVESVDKKAVAAQEKSRIEGVLEQSLPGHEDLVKALAFDGETTPEQAAIKILQAEKHTLSKHLRAIEADAQELPEIMPSKEVVKKQPKTRQEKWDSDKELRAEFNHDYGCYTAYLDAEDQGRVRILSGSKK